MEQMGVPGVKARMRMCSAGNEAGAWKQQAAGVTLLELLVVITILSLMAGLALPRIGSWLDNWKLRSAADRITQTLRYARTRALFEQHFYVVEIVPGKRLVRVLQPNSGLVREFSLPEGIRFILPPSGEVGERDLWLRNEQGKTLKIHCDFLVGKPGVETVEQGS
jgi:prepilin-type N-terminal cleavage/methylation domain-containing protein